jgi:hypothetical protein
MSIDQIIDSLQIAVLKSDQFTKKEKDDLGIKLEAMRELSDVDFVSSLEDLNQEAQNDPLVIKRFVERMGNLLKQFYQSPNQDIEDFFKKQIQTASE